MRRISVLAGLAFFAVFSPAALAADRPARVWVAPSASSAALEEALREELGPERIAAARAESLLAVTLEDDGADLSLNIAHVPRGVTLLERRIPLDHGREPAVRIALIVVVEALAAADAPSTEGPGDEPAGSALERIDVGRPRVASATEAASLHAIFGLGPELGWIKSPATPELGLRASFELGVSTIAFGLALTVLGTPGWQVNVHNASTGKETLTETPWSLSPRATFAWTMAELGPLRFGARGEIGVTYEHVGARAAAFVGTAPTESSSNVSLDVRPSATCALALREDLSLLLSAGLAVHSSRLVISLPPPFDAGSTAIDPGLLTVSAFLAMAWRMF